MSNPKELKEDEKISLLGKVGAGVGVLASIVYLLNFTMGVVEIPDNLPLIGNLDEAGATCLLLACLRTLGFDLTSFLMRKKKKQRPSPIPAEDKTP